MLFVEDPRILVGAAEELLYLISKFLLSYLIYFNSFTFQIGHFPGFGDFARRITLHTNRIRCATAAGIWPFPPNYRVNAFLFFSDVDLTAGVLSFFFLFQNSGTFTVRSPIRFIHVVERIK